MVLHISKKGQINFCDSFVSWPVFAYCSIIYIHNFYGLLCALLSAHLCHSRDVLFPQCPDCSIRAPVCKSRQLGMTGCMGLKVVKANWPSVWSWCRRITEMILDNIQFDVLPQRWLEGVCFICFFSRPGLKIHGYTWLFVPILCFSNILAQPKPPSARD